MYKTLQKKLKQNSLGLPYYDLLEPVPSVARTFLLSNPREGYHGFLWMIV